MVAVCWDSNGTANFKVVAASLLILGWIWATSGGAALTDGKPEQSCKVVFAKWLSEKYEMKILHAQHHQV